MAELDRVELISPSHYAAHGYPYEDWALLRREAPVYWFDRLRGEPFWAVTRHADIVSVSRRPDLFRNGPRLVVDPSGATQGILPDRMLLNMDPPEHAAHRSLVNKRFTPRAMTRIRAQVDAIACDILDAITNDGAESETDFVGSVAARLPIWVIAEMLGVPRSDWRLLFDWTNRVVGAGDAEYREDDESAQDAMRAARRDLFAYFEALTEERRREPRDDLVSVLTHAKVDGRPLEGFDLLSYYFLLVVAGNETTRNATSGGLHALIEHPAELERVRADRSLLKPLVEEILRWTSPVIHFCRTPVEDVELHGQKIRAGENMALFYPSANRDEAVFEEPDVFRATRRPNRHLAFGIGEHVCLGAHVARMELHVMFEHLISRLDFVEASGPIERLRSSVVGGIKHMPIRYRLRPSGRESR